MTVEHKVYDFPTFPISKQLFHVPGAYVDGGFTSGGARIRSPEPSGFSTLEIQPSLQVGEWQYPLSSWLMSKTNGQIMRVRLAPTPQISSSRLSLNSRPWGSEGNSPDTPWANLQNWAGDITIQFSSDTLQGATTVAIDLSDYGQILQIGHVIGHGNQTHMVDEIEYDENNVALITINPPARNNIITGDNCFLRPWFTGIILNGEEFRTTYDAENVGHIQLEKIILSEVVL